MKRSKTCLPSWSWLSNRDAHVWCVPLSLLTRLPDGLTDYLAPVELERARQYRFAESHDRYVLGRAMTRMIVATLLRMNSGCIGIVSDANGKPELELTSDRDLRFNLSHSGDHVLIAFVLDRAVGIDVEFVRRKVEVAELAGHLFAPRELAAFRSLSCNKQRNEFFRCWCRKEAFVKGLGLGLSLPLPDFELVAMNAAPPGPHRIAAAQFKADTWRVWDIYLDRRHMAALAVEGPIAALNLWTFSAIHKSDAGEALIFSHETLRMDCQPCL